MTKQDHIRNVVCPMVTPFDEKSNINFSKIPELLDHLFSGGIRALLVAGTTGEGMLLSISERKKLSEAVVKYAEGRFKVIIHTGCTSTRETIDLTEHSKSVGADAASVITPYFFSYSQDELFDHYSQIAKEVDQFPILLYSFPGNAGNYISTGLLRKLIDYCPNYVGIKLSDVNLIQFQEYVNDTPKKGFYVYCGVDALMLPALSIGSSGQVSGNSNVFPIIFCDLFKAFESGSLQKAQQLQRRINQIRGVFHDNIAYFKAALKLFGLDVGQTRSPIHWLDDTEFQLLQKQLDMLSSRNLGEP